MFSINKEDMSIYATRGDAVFFSVKAYDGEEPYTFNAGDVLRIKVFEKKNCDKVVLSKRFGVAEDTVSVEIFLNKTDTRFGEGINKPVEYWYEVELNPDTDAQTIIGYDDDGAKIFKLFPEGADASPALPSPDEAGFSVDAQLSLESGNPIQNRAVARAMQRLEGYINEYTENSDENTARLEAAFENLKGEFNSLDLNIDETEATVAQLAMDAAASAEAAAKSAKDASDASGGGVTSFNGRTGAVMPTGNDYTPEMVGAEPAGVLEEHNADEGAHGDLFSKPGHTHVMADISDFSGAAGVSGAKIAFGSFEGGGTVTLEFEFEPQYLVIQRSTSVNTQYITHMLRGEKYATVISPTIKVNTTMSRVDFNTMTVTWEEKAVTFSTLNTGFGGTVHYMAIG